MHFTLFIFHFIGPSKALAAEFTTSYNISYEFSENGTAQVAQETILTNQSAEAYPSEYILTLSGVNLSQVEAYHNQQPLTVRVTQTSDQQQIRVAFDPDTIPVGSATSYTWQLKYQVEGWAKKAGRLWEIELPAMTESASSQKVAFRLAAPPEWGPAAVTLPAPDQASPTPDQGQLFEFATFPETQRLFASFGDFQLYDFELRYQLENPSQREKKRLEIALLPDIPGYQKVYLGKLSPEPYRVRKDADQNFLAEFILRPQQKLEVVYTGQVLIFPPTSRLKSIIKKTPSEGLQPYLLPAKYWEVNSEEISNLKSQISNLNDLDEGSPKKDWAKTIYNYVTQGLKYDSTRISENTERFGAVKALENPQNAVCMEFTDLTVALMRAADIAAREIDGFAYTENKTQPTLRDSLHSWVQIYLPEEGWVQIDPTWGATTQHDYFSSLDTNHVAFVIKGLDSEQPYPAGVYEWENNNSSLIRLTPAANLQKDVIPFWLWWQKKEYKTCQLLLGFICF